MIVNKNKRPIVLVIAGHDPSGGAGIQADIESIANTGCHAITVITSLTAQNTDKVTKISSQDPSFFREQIKLILDDLESKIHTGTDDLKIAAEKLLSYGAKRVLITGSYEKINTVLNTLYEKNSPPIRYEWERLTDSFHGSGCTLSSRIAANIALGNNLKHAVKDAQEYTWRTLKYGFKLGKRQIHPNRFFNTENDA